MDDIINSLPKNITIINNAIKAYHIINNPIYENILVGVSGGADSDVMLDICYLCDNNKKNKYVWFDTGIEYQATKEHLNYLEERYDIKIIRAKAIKSVPVCCKEYGQPFLSKYVSDYISRLQRYGFKFTDESFESLYSKYPKCKSALQWWCGKKGENSKFGIQRNKWLKEFMVQNPPPCKFSDRCCIYSKKNTSAQFIKMNNIGLKILGIRRSEGGLRSLVHKSCFDERIGDYDNYRPLFFYTNEDKAEYVQHRNILHSKCYSDYGLKRTGCVGCPFGRNFEEELEIVKRYEPKLYKAINNIFGDSYEYTRKYKEFCKKMDAKYGSYTKYLKMKKSKGRTFYKRLHKKPT